MIMYEGVDRSCYDHSHCEAGMMCTAGGQFRKSNFRVANLGQCSDCYYATHSDRDSAVLAIETLVFRFGSPVTITELRIYRNPAPEYRERFPRSITLRW